MTTGLTYSCHHSHAAERPIHSFHLPPNRSVLTLRFHMCFYSYYSVLHMRTTKCDCRFTTTDTGMRMCWKFLHEGVKGEIFTNQSQSRFQRSWSGLGTAENNWSDPYLIVSLAFRNGGLLWSKLFFCLCENSLHLLRFTPRYSLDAVVGPFTSALIVLCRV